ncbi:MAG TPA: hypothetical protein VGQ76_27720 [Thermoanaerobaculia bacterium]|jgi:hypothetical protein|nr:hypothetical protein [Thermoanaerobaculia bacterium]
MSYRLLVAAFVLTLMVPLSAQELVSAAGADTIVKTPDQVERARVTAAGRLALGVATATGKLELADTVHAPRIHLSGTEYYQNETSTNGIGVYLGVNRTNNRQLWFGDSGNLTAPLFRMMFFADYASLDAVSLDGSTARPLAVGVNGAVYFAPGASGRVGVGTYTPNPAYKMHVVGNTHIEGVLSGTNITATYQDVAEWVPSSSDLAPGTVVVLNPERTNEVMASSREYDSMVAGVVSPQPGITLGVSGPEKEQIATMGRVRVKVDATRNPIRIGDLLVTSGNSGMAMKSTPVDVMGVAIHRPGTIIGKALESLDKGTGDILVLLSMQ